MSNVHEEKSCRPCLQCFSKMKPYSLSEFNKALASRGIPIELVKADGYFWFYSSDVRLEIDSIYTCHYSHLPAELWGGIFNDVVKQFEEKSN